MTRARKTYPPDFKAEAVRLVREDGMGVARVASSRGVDSTLVREWVKKADEAVLARTPAAKTVASMADELVQLRRENAVLREEREIPKKPRPSSRRRPGDDVPVHRTTYPVICESRAACYLGGGPSLSRSSRRRAYVCTSAVSIEPAEVTTGARG